MPIGSELRLATGDLFDASALPALRVLTRKLDGVGRADCFCASIRCAQAT